MKREMVANTQTCAQVIDEYTQFGSGMPRCERHAELCDPCEEDALSTTGKYWTPSPTSPPSLRVQLRGVRRS